MRRGALVAVVALAATLGGAAATVYNALTLEQQVGKADVIVQAKVKAVEAEDRAGKPWTVYRLDPVRFLKGKAADLPQSKNEPSVAVLGGAGFRVSRAPEFKVNDEVVLLVYAKPYDSPVVGFRQGAYRVRDGRVTSLDNKAVQLPGADGKPAAATLETFLKRLEALAAPGGAK